MVKLLIHNQLNIDLQFKIIELILKYSQQILFTHFFSKRRFAIFQSLNQAVGMKGFNLEIQNRKHENKLLDGSSLHLLLCFNNSLGKLE